MSVNDDAPETLAGVVGDNSENIHNQEPSSRDSNNSNEDGVMVNTENNGSGGDSDGVVLSDDAGREDMFMDAPEDLGVDGKDSPPAYTEEQGSTDGEEDSAIVQQTRFHGLDNEMRNDYMVDEMERLRAMLDKTLNEKENIVKEHKDEMEMAAKELTNLRDQMRDLMNKQLMLNESRPGSRDLFDGDVDQVQLHEMIHECSMFLRIVVEDVQELNSKSTEAAVSREVVSSYMDSVQNESMEVLFQKDQYIDDATNRMLSSFASLVYVGDLIDNSTTGKIAHIENSLYSLIENYNWFLYQSDQLRQCLTENRPNLAGQTDYAVIFTAANEELIGFRNKETDFAENLSHLEKVNRELQEQLDKHKGIAEMANAEFERLKTELDQEKMRYFNTKEKLSLAVTKGKALVQQRDTLKQALAGKTSEVENCLLQLNEKSKALEAAELMKEELVKSQISDAALQEVMAQKDLLLEKLEDILFGSGVPEGLGMKDVAEKTKWLVDERNALKDVSLKFHQLADALLSIDLPEKISFSDLESRLGWLTQSYDQAKVDMGMLQDEVSKTGEALNQAKAEIGALQGQNAMITETAQNEMGQLTASLSTVLVEKDCIEMALKDMSEKFEAIVQRERHALSEKQQILKILVDASGVTVSDSGDQPSETAILVANCLATLEERWTSSHKSSEANEEVLQNLQSLLYDKNQELVLRDKMLEEETQKMKSETDKLYSDLGNASDEITTLKEQNDNLKRDLEKCEDKSALIREKLSLAVKKGKGLMQEREGLRQLIVEKSSEIEKLKALENALSLAESNVSRLVKEKEEAESKSAAYEPELDKAKLEIAGLIADLSEATTKVKALEDAISHLETKLNVLKDETKEAQISRAMLEDDLKKLQEESHSSDSKLQDAHSSVKTLEDALAKAENDISELSSEKKSAELELSTLSARLNACLEEMSGTQVSSESRISELFDHLKGLESVLEDESVIYSLRKCFETKYESLKEMESLLRNIRCQFAEMDPKTQPALEEPSHLTKLLSTNFDDILGAGMVTDHGDAVELNDISLCVQKLTKSFHVKNKAVIDKVDCFLSFLKEINTSVLQELLSTSKWVTPMVQKMRNMETDYSALENKVTALEADVSYLLSACTEATHLLEFEANKQMPELSSAPEFEERNDQKFSEIKHVIAINTLLSASTKISGVCERLLSSRKSLSSRIEELQSSLNEATIAEKKAIEERDLYINKVHGLDTDLATIQNICSELKSQLENYRDIEAQLGVKNAEISSLKSTLITKGREAEEGHHWASHTKNLLERANKIQVPLEASQARDLEPQDPAQIDKLLYIIDNFSELQDQIEFLTHENTKLQTALSAQIHERELVKEQFQGSVVHEQELENGKNKIVDIQAGLNRIIQKFSTEGIVEDQEFSDVDDLVLIVEKLVTGVLLKSENLKSKAHELELEAEKSIHTQQESAKLTGQILDMEAGVRKIIKILRSDLSLDDNLLASGNFIQVLEDLVTAIVLEHETLKSEPHDLDAETWNSSNEQQLMEVKDELFMMKGGLKKIIQKLRGDASVDHRSVPTQDLLQHSEKMITALITETENSKSEIRELDSKLLGSQKTADELSLKIKSLDDSLRSRTVSPDSVQERSIFEAPGPSLQPASEISEIEDVASVSKATISPVPSSTHVRTSWKSSSDHIALNIDSETSRLIDNEAVEEKGHVFKSLNTSGLVPSQGKMIADRIDGFWISGGRLLRSHPQARLGLIAYWLLLHMFLLGTIL